MAREYAAKGIAFVFLYAREAHPGENFSAHRTMEQKLSHARAFQEQFNVERPILVDDLIGTGHKLYGMLPNMTYLIGRGGKVLFRADWSDPPTIKIAVDYVLASRARRRKGLHLAPFYAEFVGYRWHDPEQAREGMKRAGPKAIEDYERVQQRWRNRGSRPGRIEIDD
jgi:hypothetical protein